MIDRFAIDLDDIRRAETALAGRIVATPLISAPALGVETGAQVFLKLETLQHTGSFKARGALNRMSHLTADERARGVIAASAGNHAQGVAFHARRLGVPATIVMPAATPFTKVRRTEQHGASVVLEGATLFEAAEHSRTLASERGLVTIHPYDDPLIMAGQGTIGLEMLAAAPDLDVIVVPIGGGGLVAGIAIAAKALKPEIEIIGVESALYASMTAALGGATPLYRGSSLADGIAVKEPGKLTLPVVRALVSDIVVADEALIERCVRDLAAQARIIAEGSGAASLAPLLQQPERFHGRKVGLVICGGNIDDRLLASVLMRGLVRDQLMVRLRIEIADEPGQLAAVTGLIARHGGNIVEVEHRRLFAEVPIRRTDLDILVETRDARHVDALVTALTVAGHPTERLRTPD